MSRSARPTFTSLALALATVLALGACGGGKTSGTQPAAPTCTDGAKNGSETGVDCGGTTCVGLGKTCADGLGCGVAADCTGGFCNTTTHLCATPTCADTFKNGVETDVDCGGAACRGLYPAKLCANGLVCAIHGDCTSGFCNPTTLRCADPACPDGFKNGTETDVDCGGAVCLALGSPRKCAVDQSCGVSADCTSGFCNPTTHKCAAPTCTDGFKNGPETDVDCGGAVCLALGSPSTCDVGQGCGANADCASGACDLLTHTCVAVACTNDGNACPAAPGACCSGYCDTGSGQCATPCKSNGATCAAGTECCTGNCPVGTPRTCQPQGGCKSNTTACLGDTECCSGSCNFDPVAVTSACGDPCRGNSASCGFNSDCCSGYCDPSKFCANPPACKHLGSSCAGDSDCCALDGGYCNPVTQQCATAPVSSCKATAAVCTNSGECCSGACNNPTQATNAGSCTTTAFCKAPNALCANPSECCSQSCLGGQCAYSECKATGVACGSAGECCTGSCATTCQALPAPTGTSACKTLGDACTDRTQCCSSNCQGGKCTPAYLCHAPSDICYRDEDCCSGMCSAPATQTNPMTPGRCVSGSGGCNQDGAPCAKADGTPSPSTCCTRLCKDLGAGVPVCQPASGCRMTGDFCDKTEACCGGSPDTINPDGYGIFCDSVGTSPGATQYDTSTKDERNCTGGQACNPPGNICGGSGATNASQNCCNGKKAVCKQDANLIYRCFGGGSGSCPTGYDANDKNCCIPVGDVCQFRDQCCNFAPCVPDGSGVLRCTESSCTALHQPCAGADDSSCCSGTVCTYAAGSFTCEPASGACTVNGLTCAVASDCCSSNCVNGKCAPPCASTGGTCTTGTDCCTGLNCVTPPGATSGTCQSASTCAPTAGNCVVTADCCNAPTEQCLAGKCAVPIACQPQYQTCTAAAGDTRGDCCTQSPALSCIAPDSTLCAGNAECACDTCKASTQTCASTADCCVGLVCDPGSSTCKPCATVGSGCAGQAACCGGLTCANPGNGASCSGPGCTCEVCTLLNQPCNAGGEYCCGVGTTLCFSASRNGTCQATDTDCTCQLQSL